ncbi:hypothetical protein AB0P02_01135 [Streptomyces griseoluteus]|uniref:hypothetical protein n=1 Tax=Streptomyces griseoluteus TaxID=29306 RepID=UPI00341E7825
MATPGVVVYPPKEAGGRPVLIADVRVGTAFSLHDLTVFLQAAGLEGWDDLDVAGWEHIEWRGGGPETWER